MLFRDEWKTSDLDIFDPKSVNVKLHLLDMPLWLIEVDTAKYRFHSSWNRIFMQKRLFLKFKYIDVNQFSHSGHKIWWLSPKVDSIKSLLMIKRDNNYLISEYSWWLRAPEQLGSSQSFDN